MLDKQEFHIEITSDNSTAIYWLAEATELSRQRLKQCMQKGCVWLERIGSNQYDSSSTTLQPQPAKQGYIQRLRRAKKVLNKHQVLHFYYDESVLSTEFVPAILVKDLGEYSIWNKPSGMLSQGSKWGDHTTIYRWAEKHLKPERPAFIVHRLDRAANGLIILAHKKTVASLFSKMFEQRKIDKRYLVEVESDFSSMIADTQNQLTINDSIDEKTAISHVTLLAFNSELNTSTLEVQIETGRKHQIRKHLSALGFPVVGDRLYGSPLQSTLGVSPVLRDLQLRAHRLSFVCPIDNSEKIFKL